MSRMPLLAAAVAGGRRRLVDLWAAAPSAVNWQEPLGQEDIPPWKSWSRETKTQVLFAASVAGLLIVCWAIHRLFCRDDKDNTRFVSGSNDDDGDVVSSQPPPPPQEQHPLPTSVPETPVADDVETALGDVQLTQAGVEWMLANMGGLLARAGAADVDMAPAAADVETAPAPEPGPTLKCTYRTADGWAEGTCSVCLSELVDGEKVRVLTACMHCFHATCIGEWLRSNATCPLCRAPVVVLPPRRRRRRRRTQAA